MNDPAAARQVAALAIKGGTLQLANSRVDVKVCNEYTRVSPMRACRRARLAVQGPLLDADCSECCKVALNNAVLTAVGNLGGTARLGGKAALDVRNSTLHGMALEAAAGVTVSFITSRCGNCTINSSALASKMVVVNSEFDPALNETLLGSFGSCTELQGRGVCDRSAICTDQPSGGRQCSCPFGFKAGTNEDGSGCIDLCALAREANVSADSIVLKPDGANLVNESAKLSFSNFASARSHELSLRLVPKNGTPDAPLTDPSKLVKTGITSAGLYELQLRHELRNTAEHKTTICPLVENLQVQCTPGLSAADAAGLPCMPILNLSQASVRIESSTGKVLFDGSSRAPISAGDKLKVEVSVRDVLGNPVTRNTLGLAISLEGKTSKNSAPFDPPSKDHPSTFVVRIQEMWTKDAGEVQMHFLVQSKPLYNLTLQIVENASQKIAMGSTAAVLSGVLLVSSIYLMIRHGAKAKALVLSLVTKEGKMVWGFLGEGFDMVGDYAMVFAIHAAFNDTEENRLKAAPVYIPALVSLVVSTIVSLAALAVRGTSTVTQLRRRRLELKDFGKRRGYAELLDVKIEDAERHCKQTYIGVALALFEEVPMGGIGIFFLSQRYNAPWFPIASIFSSGVMLGIKVAATTTLPYWWAKLKKWQASARPVRECAALGTELVIASVESGDAPNGAGEQASSLLHSLHELRTFTRRVARSAEPLSTPDAKNLVKIIAGLLKMEHKVLHYIETLSALEDPEDPEPKPDMTQVLLSVGPFRITRVVHG